MEFADWLLRNGFPFEDAQEQQLRKKPVFVCVCVYVCVCVSRLTVMALGDAEGPWRVKT